MIGIITMDVLFTMGTEFFMEHAGALKCGLLPAMQAFSCTLHNTIFEVVINNLPWAAKFSLKTIRNCRRIGQFNECKYIHAEQSA
jgi:hypothetical protein